MKVDSIKTNEILSGLWVRWFFECIRFSPYAKRRRQLSLHLRDAPLRFSVKSLPYAKASARR
jgi:hypothetical protein